MVYINLKTAEGTETIDSFDTRKEARQMLKEYKIASDYYSGCYLSQRSTNDYKN